MSVFKSYRTRSGLSVSEMGEQVGREKLFALGVGLYREGLGIMAASVGLVPVDTSALRSSGYVLPPEFQHDGVVVYLGYGGPAAKINPKTGESTDSYALYVHENLDAFHKVGTAKYLELPFDQAKTGMDRRLAEAMRQAKHGGISGLGDPGAI